MAERHCLIGNTLELAAQVERLRDFDLLGDIKKSEYIFERDRLKREIALLNMRSQGRTSHLDGLAELLANVRTRGARRYLNNAIAWLVCSSTKSS